MLLYLVYSHPSEGGYTRVFLDEKIATNMKYRLSERDFYDIKIKKVAFKNTQFNIGDSLFLLMKIKDGSFDIDLFLNSVSLFMCINDPKYKSYKLEYNSIIIE